MILGVPHNSWWEIVWRHVVFSLHPPVVIRPFLTYPLSTNFTVTGRVVGGRLTLWPSDRCLPYLYANFWDSSSCLASSIAAWQLLASRAPWDRNVCSSHVAMSMPSVRLFSWGESERGKDATGLSCQCFGLQTEAKPSTNTAASTTSAGLRFFSYVQKNGFNFKHFYHHR